MVEHPASCPLRSASAEELRAAIVADLIEGADEWLKDSRDLMVALAPFHHCARTLGLDVAATFREAAARGPESLRAVVTDFGERNDVTLGAFGWVVVEGPEGPSYRLAATDLDVQDLEDWLSP
jgi:hypothetical protein